MEMRMGLVLLLLAWPSRSAAAEGPGNNASRTEDDPHLVKSRHRCNYNFRVDTDDVNVVCKDLDLLGRVGSMEEKMMRLLRGDARNDKRIISLEQELLKLKSSLAASVALATKPVPVGTEQIANLTRNMPRGMQLFGVRLTHGTHGRAEVLLNGEWGTVCDDSWSINHANVICRELGFTKALRAVQKAHFGRGTGPVWFDDLKCTGDENSLFACGRATTDQVNCEHSEDAGAVCADLPIRLTNKFYGRVEVFINNQWGTICHHHWDNMDAKVVCKMLGFSTTIRVLPSNTLPAGSGPIWMTRVNCNGRENHLFDCAWESPEGTDTCNHSLDAGVECGGSYCDSCS